MPLESLLQLVETLRERISDHRAALSQSEALTRYALIDPLLRELGWDTSDPTMVMPEYRVPNNQIADYVLFSDGAPVIVVESKKLDESLRGGRALDQGILYCAHTGASYFLLTDGNRWELYESGRTNPQTAFSLTDDSPAQSCLKALALWRPSVQSGQISTGQVPVTGLTRDSTHVGIPTDACLQPEPDTSREYEWRPLSGLNPEKGDPAPVEIMFPDNSYVGIEKWGETVGRVVGWLVENNLLEVRHCPIPSPRFGGRRRNIVHTEPKHPDGRQFGPYYQVGPLYVLRTGQARPFVQRAIAVIQHVGLDPADFKVRFA